MAKNQNNNVAPATQKTDPGAKKDALATALAQIEKQFGKGAVMKLGDNAAMQVDAISTGSLGLDLALGVGGVPRGRIIEVFGPESSGKTTLALHILAEAQKKGGEVAFIDVEHALDPAYAEALTARGIPVYADARENLLDAPHIRPLIALLRVIDNPAQDIYLAAAMLGPLFGFTDDDLVRLRALQRKTSLYGAVLAAVQSEEDNEFTRKARAFYARLTELRRMARSVPVEELLEEIFVSTGYLAALGAMENGQRRREDAQREPAQQGHHPHQAQHGRKGRTADDAVHAIGNADTLGQCDQQSFPQQRGGNAQIDIAHARQGDPGCKAAFGSQQHQHHGTGSSFQPKAGVPPQAQHGTAADAGQILQQTHAAKEQSSQQRCEQPDREQALGPQQLRLSHTGGCPAHAHSSQHPHHQAEPAHGGSLRRALRLGIRCFLLG